MKLEEIDQLERELTWLFVRISWDDPAARRREIERTMEYLKQLRACAKGELSTEEVQQLGVNCSACGKALPLTRSSKQRFCCQGCRQRYVKTERHLNSRQRSRENDRSKMFETSKIALRRY